MRRLRRLISIANLRARRAGTQGQITTFLLLMIAAVLIFVLATANMGRLTTTATTVANAADSSALGLGSQLATKSHALWEAMGHKTQKCKSAGFLGIILAIVIAVVAIVIAYYAGPAGGAFFAWAVQNAALVIGVGAIGGAVGGAIGGGIEGGWSGAGWGARQGFAIGAAIGGGIVVGGTAGGAMATEALAPSLLPAYELAAAYAAAYSLGATIGGIAGGTLVIGSSIYNQAMKEQMLSAAFSAAVKALNGLPERDHFRESVFLRALTQTVSDPNKADGTCHWPGPVAASGDPFDTDGDGNLTEQIPCFQYWWDRRVAQLKAGVPELRSIAEDFLGDMATFRTAAEATYKPGTCATRPPPPPPGSCGDTICNGSDTCSNCPGDCGPCPCVPTTSCAAQGKNCGSIWNGCQAMSCGSCSGNDQCINGVCTASTCEPDGSCNGANPGNSCQGTDNCGHPCSRGPVCGPSSGTGCTVNVGVSGCQGDTVTFLCQQGPCACCNGDPSRCDGTYGWICQSGTWERTSDPSCGDCGEEEENVD